MYRILDAKYGTIIEETMSPRWIKQQKLIDLPINADSYEDADGIVLSDGVTQLGIEGRNMENYTPLVKIKEISSDPYIENRFLGIENHLRELDEKTSDNKEKIDKIDTDVTELKSQSIATMLGITDVYAAIVNEGPTVG